MPKAPQNWDFLENLAICNNREVDFNEKSYSAALSALWKI